MNRYRLVPKCCLLILKVNGDCKRRVFLDRSHQNFDIPLRGGHRLAGTEANQRAVAWAEKMLRESGFDKVWLEPVEFPVWRRHHEYARVLSPYPQALQITALGYSGSTENEMVGKIVKFESLEELQQTNIDLQRKIVFLNQAMGPEPPSGGRQIRCSQNSESCATLGSPNPGT